MEDDPLKQIRTYQGDIAEILGENKESLVSIQRKEVIKNAAEPRPEPKVESGWKKAVLLLLGALVLIGLAGTIGFYSYTKYKEKTKLPEVAVAPNRFILPTDVKSVDASKLESSSLVDLLSKEILSYSQQKTGNIEQIQFLTGTTTALLETKPFINLIGSQAPASLLRAFGPLFMYGVVGGGQPSAFMIIDVGSFSNVYAGMLKWEKTLAQDMVPVFATREFIQNIAPGTSFTDVTIKNKDARIIRDSLGNTVLLYSFYEDTKLIITDSLNTLLDLEARLDNERLLR